jgi:pyruvate-ferredoxin/flavodoxin oxidoreductase
MMPNNSDAKEFFVLGIHHPMALTSDINPNIDPPNSFSMRGHSVGGYGAVTTLKVIATIVGDVFGFHVQAMPKYGSEKKGLPTNTYLTVGAERIRAHNELHDVDFVSLANINAFNIGNPLAGLRDGGTLFVQTEQLDPEGLWADLPLSARRIIRRRNIRVLGLDNQRIAQEEAPTRDLVQRMQGIVLLGVFLRSTPYRENLGVTDDLLWEKVTVALRRFFGPRRGEQVVQDNFRVVKRGYMEVMEVPRFVIDRDSTLDEVNGNEYSEMESTNLFNV